jgi:WhiB family transcriptional regulator, redox-sensing transcriptional regulator
MMLFFGPDDEPELAREMREDQARQICAGCPLRLECLDEALRLTVRYGIWGGMNWDERLRERRRRTRLASGRAGARAGGRMVRPRAIPAAGRR